MTLRANQLTSIHCQKLKTSPGHAISSVSFMDAKDLYLNSRDRAKLNRLLPKNLMDYELSNGGVFRDWLTEKVTASSSVKRVFSTIRAITNLAYWECQ